MREGFQIKYKTQGAYNKMHILRWRWRSWEKQDKKKIEQHIKLHLIKFIQEEEEDKQTKTITINVKPNSILLFLRRDNDIP